MSDSELQAQFLRCVVWQDADQWLVLGALYADRGYTLNAEVCQARAQSARVVVNVPTVLFAEAI